jgi:hypothetical protein
VQINWGPKLGIYLIGVTLNFIVFAAAIGASGVDSGGVLYSEQIYLGTHTPV